MRIGARTVITTLCLPFLVLAAPVNGDFELGTLGGWSVFGQTSVESALFGITPPQGTSHALLLTADEGSAGNASLLASFLGAPALTLQGYFGGSAIKQTFSATAGQHLLFSWNFLNGEFTNSDLAFLAVNGEVIELESSATQASASPVNTAVGTFASSGYMSGLFIVPTTGEYTIGFGIVNGSDDSVQSGLLVDNVRLADAVIPEPSTASACVIAGAAFALVATRRARLQK